MNIPDDAATPKYTEECVGKYAYMPNESRKGSGSCTYKYKDGDTVTDTFEEGSDLKEYTYKITGGTGKYKGSTRGGPYLYENPRSPAGASMARSSFRSSRYPASAFLFSSSASSLACCVAIRSALRSSSAAPE